jgi:hypothetical protein
MSNDYRGFDVRSASESERLMKLIEERFDRRFVALEEYPLAHPLRRHQLSLVKRGKVSRHGRLGHVATGVDLPGAYAILERMFLPGEIHRWFLQPGENFSPDRIGQGFVNGVDIHENVYVPESR